jgi:hypothetical protein
MSTYTIRPHEAHRDANRWTLQHPVMASAATVVAAVVAGALIGALFSLLFTGAPVAQQHRAGGHHARVAAVHAATATTGGARIVTGVATGSERSPARSGFAAGRAGGGDGFIQVTTSTRAPARGGFPVGTMNPGHRPQSVPVRSAANR